MAIQPDPTDPEPVESNDAEPPILQHTRIGTVDGRTAVWTDSRAVAGTLRGFHRAAMAGVARPEQVAAACGELADALDHLTDGLAALGTTDTTTDGQEDRG